MGGSSSCGDPGHHQAERLFTRVSTLFAHHLAGEHHQNAVGERADFIQFNGYEEDRLAGIAHFHDAAVNEFNGADIDAAGGLTDDQRLGSRSISRATTIFCWLPPEKLAVFKRGFGGRISYFSIFSAASARMA